MNPSKRILVVDDEPTILLLLRRILSEEGYEVVTANDGDEAIRLSESLSFDLFLIDLIMPRKDGIETILQLRTLKKNTPVVAMSGGWHAGTRNCLALAAKLGACATLAKPFDQKSLLGTLRSALKAVGLTASYPSHRERSCDDRHLCCA